MLNRDEFDPESQFYCYLCERIKDNAESPIQPLLFTIWSMEYTACAECWGILDKLRQFGDNEAHPVLRCQELFMVVGNDYE